MVTHKSSSTSAVFSATGKAVYWAHTYTATHMNKNVNGQKKLKLIDLLVLSIVYLLIY